MANFKTRAVTDDEFKLIIDTIRGGFTTISGAVVRPSPVVAAALLAQGNLGLRIGDIIRLKLSDFVYENGRYHFNNFVEEKTKKIRTNTVPVEVYSYLQSWALEQDIKPKERLFPIAVRTVQHHLKLTCDYLGLENISSHSFRKRLSFALYSQEHDIELVRTVLLHSSTNTTQHYLSVEPKAVEQALKHCVILPA